MKYEEPKMEITQLRLCNVICESQQFGDNNPYGDEDEGGFV